MAVDDVESIEAAFSANWEVTSRRFEFRPQIREKSCALLTNFEKVFQKLNNVGKLKITYLICISGFQSFQFCIKSSKLDNCIFILKINNCLKAWHSKTLKFCKITWNFIGWLWRLRAWKQTFLTNKYIFKPLCHLEFKGCQCLTKRSIHNKSFCRLKIYNDGTTWPHKIHVLYLPSPTNELEDFEFCCFYSISITCW